MGKRYRGPVLDGTEPVEGVETKGKLYFEMPQVITIGKPKPTYTPVSSSPASHVNGTVPNSVVRLDSSKQYAICPFHNQPKTVDYDLGLRPSYEELKRYLQKYEIMGYGKGSVVTRRYQTPWRYKDPHQWGIIIYTVNSAAYGTDFKGPYCVRWFDNVNQKEERAWAEDLVVIHTCLSKEMIEDILESQGVTET